MRKLIKKYSRKRNTAKKRAMKSLTSVQRKPHDIADSFRKYGDENYINNIKR
tara:strand:+ start:3053 stop:3208 length:156 start_codon:yes stop_codon:yes gene_type:complete